MSAVGALVAHVADGSEQHSARGYRRSWRSVRCVGVQVCGEQESPAKSRATCKMPQLASLTIQNRWRYCALRTVGKSGTRHCCMCRLCHWG